MSALRDPSNELAQQLLASEHLETERVEPWWDKPSDSLENEDSEQEKGGTSTGKQARRFGSLPEAMTIPQSLVTSQQGGNPLIYNIVELLYVQTPQLRSLLNWFSYSSTIRIAYSYTTRSLSISPLCSLKPQDAELAEAQKTISRLTPFLTDSKSTVVFPTLNACITDVWSRFEPVRGRMHCKQLMLN